MRPVIQSFKKVINHAPASIIANTNTQYEASVGVDGVAAGQTSAIDTNVPTGALIKYIEFQFTAINLSLTTPVYIASTIQLVHTGQSIVPPLTVGGNPQRNQVFHQEYFSAGGNQNTNRVFRFKVPKRVQRVREGSKWRLIVNNSDLFTAACQIVYKFYR